MADEPNPDSPRLDPERLAQMREALRGERLSFQASAEAAAKRAVAGLVNGLSEEAFADALRRTVADPTAALEALKKAGISPGTASKVLREQQTYPEVAAAAAAAGLDPAATSTAVWSAAVREWQPAFRRMLETTARAAEVASASQVLREGVQAQLEDLDQQDEAAKGADDPEAQRKRDEQRGELETLNAILGHVSASEAHDEQLVTYMGVMVASLDSMVEGATQLQRSTNNLVVGTGRVEILTRWLVAFTILLIVVGVYTVFHDEHKASRASTSARSPASAVSQIDRVGAAGP